MWRLSRTCSPVCGEESIEGGCEGVGERGKEERRGSKVFTFSHTHTHTHARTHTHAHTHTRTHAHTHTHTRTHTRTHTHAHHIEYVCIIVLKAILPYIHCTCIIYIIYNIIIVASF